MLSYLICLLILSAVSGSTYEELLVLRAEEGTEESTDGDLSVKPDGTYQSATEHGQIAGGLVSIDCLRCLCLTLSDCSAVGCGIRNGLLGCGYFRITKAFWNDCEKFGKSSGKNYSMCANDIFCASKCVQNYMELYANRNNCVLKCEGFSRELGGGPNGCNNPGTVPFWNLVQHQPGCKGVE